MILIIFRIIFIFFAIFIAAIGLLVLLLLQSDSFFFGREYIDFIIRVDITTHLLGSFGFLDNSKVIWTFTMIFKIL